MAGASDERPPRIDGPAADPASQPGAPEEEALWTALAGWADVTPTGVRLEDIDPEITPRGSLRLAPLTPLAPQPPPPSPSASASAFGPPAPPAAPPRAAPPPTAGPTTGASGWPAPAPWPEAAPRASAPPSAPGDLGGPASPGVPGPAGVPGPGAHDPWAAGASAAGSGAPFWRRRPVLAAAAASIALLLVAFGLAWVAVGPSCCSDDAASQAAAVPAATPSPAADGGWTPAQRALARRLDPAALIDCQPNPSPAGAGVAASIFCSTAEGRRVAVYSYRDADALRSDVTQRANGVPSEGRCERGENEVFSWDTGPGTPVGGTVVCHHRDGRAFLFWTSDADTVSFLAYDAEARALVDWWESFEPFPNRARPTAAPRPA